jgi:hypothetical protein
MKYRFRSNEKAIITASLPEEEKGKEIRRGMIPGVYVPDYLARRLQNNLPYLNVYDFGRFANGTDSGFLSKETLVSSTATGPSPLSGKPAAFAALLATFRDGVLAYDADDLSTTFYKITDQLSDYNISVSDFTDYVAGQGLLSPTSSTSLVLSAPTNEYFVNWSLGTRKITTTPVYAASGTTYTHDARADMFLAPHFWAWEGLGVLDTPAGVGSFPKTIYETYDMYKPLPREETINVSDWDSIWAARATTASWTSGQRDFFRSIVLGNPDSEFVQYDSDGAGGSFPVTTFAGSSFPTFYTSPPAGRSWGTSDANAPRIGLFANGFTTAGSLMAVIIKYASTGTEYYYVWASNAWVVDSAFDIGASDTYVVV